MQMKTVHASLYKTKEAHTNNACGFVFDAILNAYYDQDNVLHISKIKHLLIWQAAVWSRPNFVWARSSQNIQLCPVAFTETNNQGRASHENKNGSF